MWVVPEDLPIFARSGLRLIGVDYQVGWSNSQVKEYLPACWVVFGHERVLESTGEAGSASAAETRLFNLIDNPILAH